MIRSGTAVLALTMTCAAATALALSPGSAAGSPATRGHTLQLTLRYADASTHFVGKNANHPHPGDRFIDAAPVRAHGRVAGQATNVCTVIAGTSQATTVSQCIATFTLANGELVTIGADNSSNNTTDAVTGGTGSFASARGTARTVSGATAATITVHYSTAH